MSGKLRRNVLAVLAVAAVFGASLIVEAAIVWIKLAPSLALAERPYKGILRVVDNGMLIFLLSGFGASFVLQRFRIQQIVAYVATGAVSGWLALYCFLFGFGEAFSLFGYHPPAKAFSTILADVFVRVASIGEWVLAPDMAHIFAGATFIGVLGGGLYWLVAVRPTARRSQRATPQN